MSSPRTSKNRHLPPRLHFKNGSFYLVTGTGNKRKWHKLGRSRHEAYAEYARLIPTIERQGGTFAEVAADAVKHHWPTLAERTQKDYSRALESLLKYFGDAPIKQITPGHINRYMTLRSSKHEANREHAVLSAIFTYAISVDIVTDNPARKIGYHKTKPRKRIFTRKEWKKIWLAGLDPLPVFMDLAFITGLRVGDVLALKWSQVTPEGLYVLQSKNQVEGLYRLTPGLQSVLDRAKRLHMRSDSVSPLLKPDTAIIHTKAMKPYKYAGIRSSWDRACKRAKVEGARIHDIRRTAITMAKQSGRKPQDFSLHKTEAQANEYVVEVPTVEPLEVIK